MFCRLMEFLLHMERKSPTLETEMPNVGFRIFQRWFCRARDIVHHEQNPSFAGHRWQQRKTPSGIPLASVHVPLVGEHMAAGYLEDVFSPAVFRAAEGVSEYSVVNISATYRDTRKKAAWRPQSLFRLDRPHSVPCSPFPVPLIFQIHFRFTFLSPICGKISVV